MNLYERLREHKSEQDKLLLEIIEYSRGVNNALLENSVDAHRDIWDDRSAWNSESENKVFVPYSALRETGVNNQMFK